MKRKKTAAGVSVQPNNINECRCETLDQLKISNESPKRYDFDRSICTNPFVQKNYTCSIILRCGY